MSGEASQAQIPIKEADLAHWSQRAVDLLKSVSHAPKREVAVLRETLAAKPSAGVAWRPRSVLDTSPKTVSLLELAKRVPGSVSELMDERVNGVLNTIWQGIRVAFHIGALYAKSSGLETLRERQDRKQLTAESEQAEFRAKGETMATITVFVLAYYVLWKLAKEKNEASAASVDFAGIPETLTLVGQTSALQATLYHFASYLSGAQTSLDVQVLAQHYFKAVLEDMKARSQGVKHAEPYLERSYRLENTTFSVNGFHGDAMGAGPSVEFKRVDISRIVGNRHAKRGAYRLAQQLVAYDFEARMNPLVELGAFQGIQLMKGIPGTGKSLLLAAIMTMLHDYCKELGIPFQPHPFPTSIVSTFQGGSGENAENYFSVLRNPNSLFVAPVDDAENSYQDRTMQGVSSGVREVIGVFLNTTEGVLAINRGNSVIIFATNVPEQIDKAVLSRVLARMDVDGAQTKEDFLDQMRLWSDGFAGYKQGFVDLTWPTNYEHLSAQAYFAASLAKTGEEIIKIRDTRLESIVAEITGQKKHTEHDFYAELFVRVKRAFPFFSSRDLRNIQSAVGSQLFDFDFPAEWLAKREDFVGKPYADKKGMIIELMGTAMQGRSFAEILHRETLRYLDTMVSILDAGRKRRVDDLVEDFGIREEAKETFVKRKS